MELLLDLKKENMIFAGIGFPLLIITIFFGMLGLQILERITRKWKDISFTTLLSGIPGNKTTECALAMYRLSEMPESLKRQFLKTPLEDIPSMLKKSDEGHQFLNRLGSFIDDYGHRGPKEFDIGQPRWKDDPGFIFRGI